MAMAARCVGSARIDRDGNLLCSSRGGRTKTTSEEGEFRARAHLAKLARSRKLLPVDATTDTQKSNT